MNTDWYKNVNPNLDRLAEILGMGGGSKPSHGYTIAEKAPEVVTAPGVYFPAEKGEVIPLESREFGGLTDPSMSMADKLLWQRKTYGLTGGIGPRVLSQFSQSTPTPAPTSDPRFSTDLSAAKGFAPTGEDLWKRKREEWGYTPRGYTPREKGGTVSPSKDNESRKLDMLESILSNVRPSNLESRQMGGSVIPPFGEAEKLKIEQSKYDILKSAISVLKPEGKVKSPSEKQDSTLSSKPSEPGFPALPKEPALPKPPSSMINLPTSKSFSIQPDATRESDIIDLTKNEEDRWSIPMFPRAESGPVTPPVEEDEMDKLRRLLKLGVPEPEGDIIAGKRLASTVIPESLELASREKWEKPDYGREILAKAQEISPLQ